MGHDITAFNPNADHAALRVEFDLDNDDYEGWADRYDAYLAQVEIASNRRSAGNPLNQVLYLALGVMDEAYCGSSGCGVELSITKEQFETAAKILDDKAFEGMTRERNTFDDIMETFQAVGVKVIRGGGNGNGDVSQEKEFVRKCLVYLEETGEEELDVSFS